MLVVDTGSPGGAWTEAMTMERMRRRRRLRGWFRCCLLHSSQRRVPRPPSQPLATPGASNLHHPGLTIAIVMSL